VRDEQELTEIVRRAVLRLSTDTQLRLDERRDLLGHDRDAYDRGYEQGSATTLQRCAEIFDEVLADLRRGA